MNAVALPQPQLASGPVFDPALDPTFDLDLVSIDPKWALKVPAAYAVRKHILPLCKIDQTVYVACLNVRDIQIKKTVEKYLGHSCSLIEVERDPLERALKRTYDKFSLGEPTGTIQTSTAADDRENPVAICDELIQAAVLRNASDIHLVPNEQCLMVQLRVDGILEAYCEIPKLIQPLVVSRLKVLAGMDIAEKRAAQDGRITAFYASSGRKLEIRAASLPTRFGERITLRLLAGGSANLSLQSLGMREQDLHAFRSATSRPHGLVLLTGPTGSGKSTTLYVAIEHLLKTCGGNVITIEDPVEYEIRGASQVEVDSADKVNFSKALRSILRHDPDVVMIGEIRDHETADTAIKAAMTGHLVFSTLHTNTSAGVVTRLIDMGVEPFLVAATLRLSVAQRLIRKLCPACRKERTITQEESLLLHRPELRGMPTFDPVGCLKCAGKGYAGRIGLFEMLENNAEIADLIAGSVNESIIADSSKRLGGSALIDDGIAKILDGTSSVAEIVSAVSWG